MVALIHTGLGLIIGGLSALCLFASGAIFERSKKDKSTAVFVFVVGIALLSASLASFFLAGAA